MMKSRLDKFFGWKKELSTFLQKERKRETLHKYKTADKFLYYLIPLFNFQLYIGWPFFLFHA